MNGDGQQDRGLGRAKLIALVIIVLVGVWALWPEHESGGGTRGGGARLAPGADVGYVIRFSPGPHYFPGSRPFGIGKPLQGLRRVVRAFEERFPDTRVEVLNTPRVREYLVTQLSGGRAPDIIDVNVEDVWTDIHKGWYVPLDRFLEAPNPFVAEKGDPSAPGAKQWWDMFRYQAISRGKAAPDSRNYCITFDMIETGIYYNKDMFAELGLEVPRTWGELIEVGERLKASGRTPLVMHIGAFHDWLVDLLFDQLYYDLLPGIDLDQDPVREPYLKGYLDWHELAYLRDRGFFDRRDPRYVELWKLMRQLKAYTNQDLMTTDTVREFINQRAAMIWHVTSLSYRLSADRKLGFD